MPFRTRRAFSISSLFLIIGYIGASAFFPYAASAQSYGATPDPSSTITINAQTLIPKATAFVDPPSETVIEGSTFQVSVYINTEQNSVNTVDLTVQFPADKLSIVSPNAGKSLIQVWLQPPTYSNVDGTAHYTGIIPNGVVTASGLISTITFKAIAPGEADVLISPESSLLANDGLGTQMTVEYGRASYTITPQPPSGVTVFSPTHQFSSEWYNNASPVLQWEKDPDVTDFSYVLDNDPNTVPPDTANTTGTTVAYQNLGDGLWYFHIKARKLGIWGATTNFLIQIDTQPPASFTPLTDIIGSGSTTKALVSFFTTDALSGIDHYEVAVTDNNAPPVASPVFVQAESPYQLSTNGPGSYHVTVRAIDRAGNVKDASIDFTISVPLIEFLQKNDLQIIIALLLLVILLFLLHYFFGHKLLRRVHRAIIAAEREDHEEQLEEAQRLIEHDANLPTPPEEQ